MRFWSAFSSSWSSWWIGDAVSDLVGAPFLFVWVDQARREWRFDRLSEALGALAVPLSTEDLSRIEEVVPLGAARGERYAAAQMVMLDSER